MRAVFFNDGYFKITAVRRRRYGLPIHIKIIRRQPTPRFDLDHSPKKTHSAVRQEPKPSVSPSTGDAARTAAPVKAVSCNASLSLYLRVVAWPSVATPTAKRSHHGMDNASSD